MKKLLLSFAALLLASLALSQEANDFGSYAEVTLIPRLDVNPSYSGGTAGFNFGNSSFYTLFEGAASDHFSWTVANHWLHATDGTAWLYEGAGRSDATNFLDFFKADLSFGSWNLTLGKDMIATGGFEYDDWDWDVYTQLASPLWNGLACYQWGAKLAWTDASETTTLALQAVSSPYGEHPFSSGLWAYSGSWSGEYGPYSVLASATALQADASDFDYLISLGQRLSYDSFCVTLDWSNLAGFDELAYRQVAGNSFQGRFDYYLNDEITVGFKGNLVSSKDELLAPSFWNAGTILEFRPLDGSDDLRLHAYIAYNSFDSSALLSIGARYNLSLLLW